MMLSFKWQDKPFNENIKDTNAIAFADLVQSGKDDGFLEGALRQYQEEFDDVFSGETSSKGTFTALNDAGLSLRPSNFDDLSYFKTN